MNKIELKNFLANGLPDKCAKLIIADPPYFEVKGAFDFVWADFKDYLKDVATWVEECKRLLADNGTLFWYGHAKTIAYTQVILDEHLELINALVWNKGEGFMGLQHSKELRMFAPCTERILMYSNERVNIVKCIYSIRDYLRAEIEKSKGKVVLKEVNAAIGTATNGGGVASDILSLQKSVPGMVTKEIYEKLQDWCAPHMAKPYEELRAEYEAKRRHFYNGFKLQEVLNFSNEQNTTGSSYSHETVKPENLTRALILTCSKEGDLVVVPFAGSGTECAMCVKEGRPFYGYEINPKHVKEGNLRVRAEQMKPNIFRN